MLYNLEPDRSVTGGAWYSGQEFDWVFVNVLTEGCFNYLKDKVRTGVFFKPRAALTASKAAYLSHGGVVVVVVVAKNSDARFGRT